MLWGRGCFLSREDLLDKVSVFAGQLPDLPYAINLCNKPHGCLAAGPGDAFATIAHRRRSE